MPLDLHLFRIGDFRLAYAPVSDSLFRLDEPGWDTLILARKGVSPAGIERGVAGRHGREAAGRCLLELARVVGAYRLDEPDPLAGPPAQGESDAAGWLPSQPENPVIRALCLNVAHDCDLRCRYCFAGQGRFGGRRGLMPAEVARAAVDFLLSRSLDSSGCEIDFFGGEPLLNFEVVRETVAYARERGQRLGKRVGFTITTNALSLDSERISYLNEAMDNVVLSLDGRPEVHDRVRIRPGGGPSQAGALANIRRFIAARGDRDYWVRGTYTAWNLDFSQDVAYLAQMGVRKVSLEPVVGGPTEPGGYGLGTSHLPAIAREYVKLAEFLAREKKAGRDISFFHFIAEPEAGPCFAKRVRGCGAGREYMAVVPSGDLYPCHQFAGQEEFRAGNVLEARNGGAKERSGLLEGGSWTDVGRLWLGAKRRCLGCWARYRCSGGCHANALAATGSLTEPDPIQCEIQRSRLEASLYLAAMAGAADP